jgi:WG containing repeat
MQWLLVKANRFKEDYAKITNQGKFGFIDKYGTINVPCVYGYVNNFSDGFAVVRTKNKYGIIRKDGKEIIASNVEQAKVLFASK